jgi:hypothetical protein
MMCGALMLAPLHALRPSASRAAYVRAACSLVRAFLLLLGCRLPRQHRSTCFVHSMPKARRVF